MVWQETVVFELLPGDRIFIEDEAGLALLIL